ncbi:MAG: hypothetical protein ACQEXX_01215 [Bacillota bacterium]
MSNHILKSFDSEGNLLKESSLTLKEGEILVLTLPEKITLDEAETIHNSLSHQLESQSPIITLKYGSKLQILEVKEKFGSIGVKRPLLFLN